MNANGINVKINSNLLPKNNCLHNAQISIKKKQYSLAIGYIDEGLICKKSCTEDRS